MPENFDPQESALIGRYFTNLDKDIFIDKGLTENESLLRQLKEDLHEVIEKIESSSVKPAKMVIK